MYLITRKETNVVLNWDEKLKYWNNGYPVLMPQNIAYIADISNVFEISEVPAEVEPKKYCYTEEQGFFENPDYVPPRENPYGISDGLLTQIQEDTAAQVMADVAAKGVTAVE